MWLMLSSLIYRAAYMRHWTGSALKGPEILKISHIRETQWQDWRCSLHQFLFASWNHGSLPCCETTEPKTLKQLQTRLKNLQRSASLMITSKGSWCWSSEIKCSGQEPWGSMSIRDVPEPDLHWPTANNAVNQGMFTGLDWITASLVLSCAAKYINGLVRDCSNSSASTMELLHCLALTHRIQNTCHVIKRMSQLSFLTSRV